MATEDTVTAPRCSLCGQEWPCEIYLWADHHGHNPIYGTVSAKCQEFWHCDCPASGGPTDFGTNPCDCDCHYGKDRPYPTVKYNEPGRSRETYQKLIVKLLDLCEAEGTPFADQIASTIGMELS